MVRKQTTRQKLHIMSERFGFHNAPTDVTASYDSFPFILDGTQITDEFVWGVQEFADLMVERFKGMNKIDEAETIGCYASAILYFWWKTNVRDNEFKQYAELDV